MNRYCVPPRYIGHHLTIKADSSCVTIYDQHYQIVSYARCWQRGQTVGGERFQQRTARPTRGGTAVRCSTPLDRPAESDRSLARQVRDLLFLVREYGPEAVLTALTKAHAAGAFGAEYIANILRQQQTRREVQPPLRLQDPLLNELATDPLSLLDYDRFILNSKKDSDDPTTTETGTTEAEHDEPPSGSDVG